MSARHIVVLVARTGGRSGLRFIPPPSARFFANQIISPVFEKLAQSDEYKDKAGFYTVRVALVMEMAL